MHLALYNYQTKSYPAGYLGLAEPLAVPHDAAIFTLEAQMKVGAFSDNVVEEDLTSGPPCEKRQNQRYSHSRMRRFPNCDQVPWFWFRELSIFQLTETLLNE